VAAGLVPAAHANDIAGSIRIPAAQCGLVGLKPGRGRVVPGHRSDPAVGMNTEGVLTRTVRDTAALLDAIADRAPGGPWPAPALPGPLAAEVGRPPGRLRIGLCIRAFNDADVDAGCAAAAVGAAKLLEQLGAARLGRSLGEDDVEPLTWRMVDEGRRVTGAEVLALLDRQHELAREAATWWVRAAPDGHDILLTPTTAEPAPPLGAYKRGYAPGRASAFTRALNATGQPALSLPLGWPDDGLPRGVQLVAAHGREDLLVRLGAQLEHAAPWAERRPRVC
jgi:amidase